MQVKSTKKWSFVKKLQDLIGSGGVTRFENWFTDHGHEGSFKVWILQKTCGVFFQKKSLSNKQNTHEDYEHNS